VLGNVASKPIDASWPVLFRRTTRLTGSALAARQTATGTWTVLRMEDIMGGGPLLPPATVPSSPGRGYRQPHSVQPFPRCESTPSLAMIGTITRPATGSAHTRGGLQAVHATPFLRQLFHKHLAVHGLLNQPLGFGNCRARSTALEQA
jgi:hypothetical protein